MRQLILNLAIPAALWAQAPAAPHIAVIEADSTILRPGNPFLFGGRSLVFRPAAGGYTPAAAPLDFDEQLGERSQAFLTEAIKISLPFSFRFFGRDYRTAYAYMHGVVMFGQAEPLDQRVYPDVLTRQPPMIAALYHPAQRFAPGVGQPDGLYVKVLPDRVVITWYRVMPAQVEEILNTFQATLYRDGRIRVAYQDIQYPEGMVGLSTGDPAPHPAEVRLLDHGSTALSATFYEWFRNPQYDARAVARAFYRAYPDSFDALAIFENFPVSHAAVALTAVVKNDIRGIGLESFDHSAQSGSAGRLQSVHELNTVARVHEGTRTGMLGHEFGHRWLAYVSYLDGNGRRSDLNEGGHWCRYVDTRTGMTYGGRDTYSFLFGDKWDELPDGRFRSGAATAWGYSPLDLYLMGLLPPDSVPDFFFIAEQPGAGAQCSVSGPQPTAGRRKVVSVRQILAAEGPREPDVTRSQKHFRTAFVLLVLPGRQPSADEIARLDRLRGSWERDFPAYTGGRVAMDTRLRWDTPGAREELRDTGGPILGGSLDGAFRLRAEAKRFVLQWTSGGSTRRIAIPRSWLIPPRQEAAERDDYVSSFEYDTAVTAFPIGNGAIGLHVSSYAIAPEGSSGAAAGRDVFLVLEPNAGTVRPGLVNLGVTKERHRAVGCPTARATHFLVADVNGDGLADIARIDERVYCLEVFGGGELSTLGPRYMQSPVWWFVYRAGRWRHESLFDGTMPERRLELPLIGITLTPVDVMAYATWRTYDASKWGDAATSSGALFVPAYRRKLVERGEP